MRFLGFDPNALLEAARRSMPDEAALAGLTGHVATLEAPATSKSPTLEAKVALGPNAHLRTITDAGPTVVQEVIVQKLAPVYRIVGGRVDLTTSLDAGQIWGARIEAVTDILSQRFDAIGRIEACLAGNRFIALGTGWLVDPEIIVTNRHVADFFAERGTAGLTFRRRFPSADPMAVRVDFADDAAAEDKTGLRVEEVLHLSSRDRPDLALLRVASQPASRGVLPLMQGKLAADAFLAVVGYPERDDRADQEDVARLFGDVFGHKRLAPGLVASFDDGTLRHLCNTLGGNSGSPVLNLATGEVAGVHFGGKQAEENYAEPAAVLSRVLKDLRAAPPPKLETTTATSIVSGVTRLTIPLQLTVEIGDGVKVAIAVPAPSVGVATPGPGKSLEEAAAAARQALAGRSDVVAVRTGWRFVDGWITDTPAIVVSVERKLQPAALAAAGRTPIPTELAGHRVDIAVAGVEDLFPEVFGEVVTEARAPAAGTYRPRPELPLNRASRRMRGIVHTGPDAGVGMLREFLSATRERLTVGMYRFTAPHVLQEVLDALAETGRLTMVLDLRADDIGTGAKAEDLRQAETVRRLKRALGDRLTVQRASIGTAGGVFPYAYHIKVAVRDGEALWLSSGSWQSSNQPSGDVPAGADDRSRMFDEHNREMHVILEDEDLARTYEEHIRRDMEESRQAIEEAPAVEPLVWLPQIQTTDTLDEARAAPVIFPALGFDRPIEVQPILTPDNYAEHVVRLLRTARRSIRLQNQSFGIVASMFPAYRELLEALLERQRAGLDVRILMRAEFARTSLEAMKTFGFDVGRRAVRLQERCHNKMIVVDDEQALIGSHNWTNSGTVNNRDASLLFADAEIARYCAEVFEHDWARSAGARVREDGQAPQRVVRGERIPPGMREVPLAALELF